MRKTSEKLSQKFSFKIKYLFNERLSFWFLERACGLLVMFIYNQNIFSERYFYMVLLIFWKLLFDVYHDPKNMYSYFIKVKFDVIETTNVHDFQNLHLVSLSFYYVKSIHSIIINIIGKAWIFNKQEDVINENISLQVLKIILKFVLRNLLLKCTLMQI